MKRNIILDSMLLTGAALSTTACADGQEAVQSKPNVVFILADDLGWGDLSCYGQGKFSTPNIDRLASEGLRFTQCYSGTTVSAPSRSCLVTGTHSGHTAIRGNMELQPEGQFPLLEGRKGQKEHDYLYFEFQEMNGRQAVRKGPWKLIHMNIRSEKDYYELYNIEEDPSETLNLIQEYPEKAEELKSIMTGAHVPNPYFPVLKEESAQCH